MGTSTGKTDEPSVKAFQHIFRGARVDWQARSGEPMQAYMTRIADALADYADEIRRRAT